MQWECNYIFEDGYLSVIFMIDEGSDVEVPFVSFP